jgi:hypothetical protein
MYRLTRFAGVIVAAFALLTMLTGVRSAFGEDNCQAYDATAMGTSTQLGKQVNIKLRVCKLSTPEDRQLLVAAYKKGKTPGLTDALQKMPSVGNISLPSTTGYDLSYIRSTPTAKGRVILFVTSRKIAFGELYNSTRSLDYSLTAGRLDLNDKNPKLSSGVLYPAAKITTNKKGEIVVELYRNPWKLQNIIDWNNRGKE